MRSFMALVMLGCAGFLIYGGGVILHNVYVYQPVGYDLIEGVVAGGMLILSGLLAPVAVLTSR